MSINPNLQVCKSYGESISRGDKLVIFVQSECPYCEEAKQKLSMIEIPETMIDNLPNEVLEIDVNECNDLMYKFEIKVTPTFIRTVNGKEVGRVEGYDEDALRWILTMQTKEKPQEEEDEEGQFLEEEEEEYEEDYED